jgi:pyruvate,water dikinase
VGNKAARLAELRGRGFNVPPGLVLTASFCEGSPAESAIRDAVASLANSTALWAVRSSGIAEDGEHEAMAGRYRTELDVASSDIPGAVQRCIDAAARADQRDGRDHQPVAILVQQMVPADFAGVAFSRDPVTGDDVRVVSAVAGLGESLVSGLSLGEDWDVRDGVAKARGPAALLNETVAAKIAATLDRVEAEFGGPQDMEWALGSGELFVLQARPITALPVAPPEAKLPAGTWVKDVSHYPNGMTPLAASVYLPALEEGLAHAFPRWGLLVEAGLQLIHKHEVYMQIVPLGGPKPGAPPPAWVMGLVSRIAPPLRNAAKLAAEALQSGLADETVKRWEEHGRANLDASLRDLRAVDMAAFDDDGAIAHFDRCVEALRSGQRQHFELLLPYVMSIYELVQFLERHCSWDATRTLELVAGLSEETSGPARALASLGRLAHQNETVRGLLEDSRIDEHALPARLRAEAPEFASLWDEFVERWAHRVMSYDLGDPTLAERPAMIRRRVLELAVEETDHLNALATRRAGTEADARASLPESLQAEFEDLLRIARERWPCREQNVAYTDSMTNAVCRYAALEIGRRLTNRGQLARPGDVAMFTRDEMVGALKSGEDVRGNARRRHAERAWVAAHPGPRVLGGRDHPPPDTKYMPEPIRRTSGAILWMVRSEYSAASTSDVAGQLRGQAAAPGVARGTVRIVNGPQDFHRVRTGDILVCPTTTPAWTILFPTLAGLVSEGGGVLAHPAIAAREHHLPAVVGVERARSKLVDGQMVEVDGTRGTVTVVP